MMVSNTHAHPHTHIHTHTHTIGVEESPSTLLWTRVFLAQHFDKIGNFVRALELIEQAIDHTPTEVQLYMTKARIFKVCETLSYS